MELPVDAPFQLGEWIVRPRENSIERGGQSQSLEPKVMEVLVFFASDPGRVHLRQEILDSVWPDTFITDEVLTNAVWELRRAFGDDARQPRFIKTIPRKGYRLVADIGPLEEHQEQPLPTESSKNDVRDVVEGFPHLNGRRRLIWFVAAGILGVLAAAAIWWSNSPPRLPAATGPRSIVVLPIEALSSDPTHQHFADALTDTLTAELASEGTFEIGSRSTVVELSEASVSAVDIAGRLDVDAFLEGTLSFSATGRVRLSSQLIDRRRDRHLWSEILEEDVRDSLGAERRLSRRVVARLTRSLRPRAAPSDSTDHSPPTASIALGSALPEENAGGWTFRTGGEVWSAPVASAGLLLVGSDDGNLYALDPDTGEERWRLAAPGALRDTVGIGETDAFLATSGYAMAVDLITGTERWRQRLTVISPLVYSPAGGGVLIGGAYDRHAYGLDPRDGTVRWKFPTRGEARITPAVSGTRALVGTDQGQVTVIDLQTERVMTEVALDSAIAGAFLTPSGECYIATDLGFLYHLADDGSEVWRRSLNSRLGVAPLLHQGILYQGTGDGRLLALDAVDGFTLWTFSALDGIATTPRFDHDRLLVGSLDHHLYSIDLGGRLQWSFATGGWIVSRPIVVDNHVVFASLDGTVYGLPATGPPEPLDHADWPDPGKPRIVGNEAGPDLLWSRKISTPVRLAVDEDVIIVTTERGVSSFDNDHGKTLWEVPVADGFESGPVISDGVAMAVSRKGIAFALDVFTGSERWRQDLGAATAAQPVVVAEHLYIGDRKGRLNALDRETGRIQWRSSTNHFINGGAVVVGDRVIVGSCDESVWAFGKNRGERLWRTDAGECVVTDGVRFEDIVVFGSFSGDLFALAVDDGVRRWTYRAAGEEIWYRPLVLEGRVYFGSGDYHFYALDAASGQEIWRFRTENRVLTEIAAHGDLILFGSHDRHLYAIDRESGEERWRLETTRDVQHLVVAKDRLIFLGDDGYLFVYQL